MSLDRESDPPSGRAGGRGDPSVRWLVVAMAREEFRLHARLFGGRRFVAFPGLVAVLAGAAAWALLATGTPFDAVTTGLHALAFVFGLQTGAVGLISTDALEGLVGEVTLLLSSATSLPVSERRLYAAFLLKDVGYYTGLFLAPVALAVGAVGLAATAGVIGPVATTGAIDGVAGRTMATTAPLLAGTLAATFALGTVTTLLFTGLVQRRPLGWLGLFAVVAGVGGALVAGVDLLRWTPYGLYRAPSPTTVLTGLAPVAAVTAVGWLAFDPGYRRPARSATARFDALFDRLPDPTGIVTRTLLELHRSGGGVSKVVVSGAIVAGAAIALLELAGRIAGQRPAPALALGSLLGLTAFTTYNWLTAFDGFESYRTLPLTAGDVIRAKLVAFLVMIPIGGGLYAIGVVWFGTALDRAVAGGVLYLGLSVYLFGLTAYLAGLSPADFLFDTLLFALFSAAVAIVLVPILVLALAATTGVVGGIDLSVGLILGGVALTAVGYELAQRAGPRWERALATD